MSNQEMTIVQDQPATMTASNAVFNPQALQQLKDFADMMSNSSISVPAHFVGKPADCMAVVMQAMQWGMNPYAVAQKTHLINGVLGYEAQLVNAVISSSNVIQGRFHYRYEGDWSKCSKTKEETVQRPAKGGGTYGKTERVKGWTDADEEGLSVCVGAVLRGETEITWGEPVYFSGVVTRNSPLWVSNPKQQIAYLGVKYWSRLYCPEVILGVYTPDELDDGPRVERDITPQRTSASDLNNVINGVLETTQEENTALIAELSALIQDAATLEEAATAGEKVKESQSLVSKNAYEELLYAAKVKYARIDSHHCIEAAINSLDLGGEDPAGQFSAVEKELKKREQKLGAELFEAFTITLNDLRPEFQ